MLIKLVLVIVIGFHERVTVRGFHPPMFANAQSSGDLASKIIFSAARDLPIQDVALCAARKAVLLK